MKEKRICLAFDLIRQYATLQGWIPIGHKMFTIGDWRVEVNGTRKVIGKLSPFHALVENQRYIGAMVMHPYGGSVGGYKDTEPEFVAAIRAAITELKENADGVRGERGL